MNIKKELREYLAKLGAKGGKTTGKTKSRGDSEYYKRISRMRKTNAKNKINSREVRSSG